MKPERDPFPHVPPPNVPTSIPPAGVRSMLPRWFVAAVVVAGVMLIVFGVLAEQVVEHGPLTSVDYSLMMAFHRSAAPGGTEFFAALTWLGAPVVIGALAVVVVLILGVTRKPALLAGWVTAVAGGGVLDETAKLLVRRPRPPFAALYIDGASYSFPSGHAVNSMLAYGMLAYLLIRWIHRRGVSTLIVAAAALLILAIGFSRLYLGVHYFSDVVGGYAIGGFWLSVSVTGTEIAQRFGVGFFVRRSSSEP